MNRQQNRWKAWGRHGDNFSAGGSIVSWGRAASTGQRIISCWWQWNHINGSKTISLTEKIMFMAEKNERGKTLFRMSDDQEPRIFSTLSREGALHLPEAPSIPPSFSWRWSWRWWWSELHQPNATTSKYLKPPDHWWGLSLLSRVALAPLWSWWKAPWEAPPGKIVKTWVKRRIKNRKYFGDRILYFKLKGFLRVLWGAVAWRSACQ